uniref:Secreted protein n=1 Tax=Panagrellus redivivus TaxID=6233 RepID=A0A7E4ZX50_PANRE
MRSLGFVNGTCLLMFVFLVEVRVLGQSCTGVTRASASIHANRGLAAVFRLAHMAGFLQLSLQILYVTSF